jgi:hypothetical protein
MPKNLKLDKPFYLENPDTPGLNPVGPVKIGIRLVTMPNGTGGWVAAPNRKFGNPDPVHRLP